MSNYDLYFEEPTLEDLRIFIYNACHNVSILPALALKKLTAVENFQPLDTRAYSANLCRVLLDFFGYAPGYDKEVIQKATDLFLKHAGVQEKVTLSTHWYNFRSKPLEDILRTTNWLAPFVINPEIYSGFSVALKFGHTEWIESFLANLETVQDGFEAFARALDDIDTEIRQAARNLLPRVSSNQKREILNAFALFIDCYNPHKILFLIEQGYNATHLPLLHTTMALLQDEYNWTSEVENSSILHSLVELLDESELGIKAAALLRNLPTKTSQSSLCSIFLLTDNPFAEKLIVECGYEPQDLTDKLLFYFLTQQFTKYNALDSDYSKLRAYYQAAPSGMRRRIARIVKQSGNQAYRVIVSTKQNPSAAEFSPIKTKNLLQTLRDNQQWDILWQKVLELPYMGSISGLGLLIKSGWQAPNQEEKQLYQKLVNLMRAHIANPTQLKEAMPATVQLQDSFLEVPQLLTFPFLQGTEEHLLVLKLLRDNCSAFPAPVQNSLAYIQEILLYRFRYAIEIDIIPDLAPNESDIEL